MALSNIYGDIFDYVKAYVEENSTYSPTVVQDTPEDGNVFPLVTVKQYNERLRRETLSKTEKLRYLIYDVEIFANDNQSPRQEIVREIANLVDVAFEDNLGFTQTKKQELPYIKDNVSRIFMEFKCYYDVEQEKIYRY